MRLKVIMECDKGKTLGYNYNHHLFKAVSTAVQASGTMLPRSKDGLFTFSQLYFDQYCVSESGIKNMGSCVHWFVSSPKNFFLEGVLKGLKQLGSLTVENLNLPIQDIEILADPEIGTEMEFSCMSPITVTAGQDFSGGRPRYGRIEDRDFADRLRQDLISKYYKVHDSLPEHENLEFSFNQRYMNNRRRVSRLVDYNGVKILGYMIPFTVKGNPELIKLGYQLGFGSKNNQGFGMVKVWHRTEQQDRGSFQPISALG